MTLLSEDALNALWMSCFFAPALTLPGWLVLRRSGEGWSRTGVRRALIVTLVWGLAPLLIEVRRLPSWSEWPLFWLRPFAAAPLGLVFSWSAAAAWIVAFKTPQPRSYAVAAILTSLWWSWSVLLFGHALT